jgi:hypothetical protein
LPIYRANLARHHNNEPAEQEEYAVMLLSKASDEPLALRVIVTSNYCSLVSARTVREHAGAFVMKLKRQRSWGHACSGGFRLVLKHRRLHGGRDGVYKQRMVSPINCHEPQRGTVAR